MLQSHVLYIVCTSKTSMCVCELGLRNGALKILSLAVLTGVSDRITHTDCQRCDLPAYEDQTKLGFMYQTLEMR